MLNCLNKIWKVQLSFTYKERMYNEFSNGKIQRQRKVKMSWKTTESPGLRFWVINLYKKTKKNKRMN